MKNEWWRPRTWLVALIRGYQKIISPHTPPVCRFSPTCSAYAIEAVSRFGVCLGAGLAVRRILRCNPLFPGGYDPVPERFPWPRIKKPGAGKTEKGDNQTDINK